MMRYINCGSLKLPTIIAAFILVGAFAAQAQMRGNFDDADANHDGRVTLQEYQTYVTNRLGHANGRLARKFKQLSSQEQSARIEQRFDKMDKDHKGYLTKSDWAGS